MMISLTERRGTGLYRFMSSLQQPAEKGPTGNKERVSKMQVKDTVTQSQK